MARYKPYDLNQAKMIPSGFHSRAVVEAIEQSGVDVYIADRDYRRRDPAFATAPRHKERARKERELKRRRQAEKEPRKHKRFSLQDFFYDEAKELCICPAGHRLYSQRHQHALQRVSRNAVQGAGDSLSKMSAAGSVPTSSRAHSSETDLHRQRA